MIHVRFGKLPEKLTSKAGQAFHVTPLTFRIKRVKSQRTLARTTHPGQANQLVARQHQVDRTQVMFTRTFNNNVRSGHQANTENKAGSVTPRGVILRETSPDLQATQVEHSMRRLNFLIQPGRTWIYCRLVQRLRYHSNTPHEPRKTDIDTSTKSAFRTARLPRPER